MKAPPRRGFLLNTLGPVFLHERKAWRDHNTIIRHNRKSFKVHPGHPTCAIPHAVRRPAHNLGNNNNNIRRIAIQRILNNSSIQRKARKLQVQFCVA